MSGIHESKSGRHPWRALLVIAAMVATVLSVAVNPAAAAEARVVVDEGESIQAAIDAAEPGTTIVVRGDHQENIWVNKDGIRLVGQGATLTGVEAELGSSPCFPFPESPVPIVCAAPTPSPDGPPAPEDYLEGFVFQGFTVDGSVGDGDGISTVFVNDVTIRRNTVTGTTCDAIFTTFSDGFKISRNTVDGTEICAGISVGSSVNGVIRNNEVRNAGGAGIFVADVSNARIRNNVAEDSCVGIVVIDGDDGGQGVREEPFPGNKIRVVNNVANNNTGTCPFGPVLVGQTGISVGGVTDVVIRGNMANNNGGDAETLIFGGIYVSDFTNLDGSVTPAANVRVIGNTAMGNSTAAGPADLAFETEGVTVVRRNNCGVSTPDPADCQ